MEVSKEKLVKAFDIWERDFREHPEKYMTQEKMKAMASLTLSEQRAEVLIELLGK